MTTATRSRARNPRVQFTEWLKTLNDAVTFTRTWWQDQASAGMKTYRAKTGRPPVEQDAAEWRGNAARMRDYAAACIRLADYADAQAARIEKETAK